MATKLTNEEFLALPQAKKAVLLAKDVIAQVKARKLKVHYGSYVEYDYGDDAVRTELRSIRHEPAQEYIGRLMQSCAVCAKGALFLCHIERANKATVEEVVGAGSSQISKRMVTEDHIFDQVSFDLIETAFERFPFGVCKTHHWHPDTGVEVEGDPKLIARGNKAMDFGDRFAEDSDRLVAIMLNVIENNGAFVPEKRITRQQVRDALRVKKTVRA